MAIILGRMTTPRHIFPLPFKVTNIANGVITYSQGEKPNENILFVKREQDIEIDAEKNCVYVDLTQEETKMFSASERAYVQQRYITMNNKAILTEAVEIIVVDSNNEEVL